MGVLEILTGLKDKVIDAATYEMLIFEISQK